MPCDAIGRQDARGSPVERRDERLQAPRIGRWPPRGRMDVEFESLTGELVATIEARVDAELARGPAVKVPPGPTAGRTTGRDTRRIRIELADAPPDASSVTQ